jgi:mannonate dehydratase
MARAVAAYRDVGYQYMLMPDHVPQIDGRDPSGVAFAYCYGYIQALIDALARPPADAVSLSLSSARAAAARP